MLYTSPISFLCYGHSLFDLFTMRNKKIFRFEKVFFFSFLKKYSLRRNQSIYEQYACRRRKYARSCSVLTFNRERFILEFVLFFCEEWLPGTCVVCEIGRYQCLWAYFYKHKEYVLCVFYRFHIFLCVAVIHKISEKIVNENENSDQKNSSSDPKDDENQEKEEHPENVDSESNQDKEDAENGQNPPSKEPSENMRRLSNFLNFTKTKIVSLFNEDQDSSPESNEMYRARSL